MLKFSQNLLENLRPRAITRDLDWGVPVPLDGWRDQPLKRLYVWFDAVIGYLSASVEWASGPEIRTRGGSGGSTRTPAVTTSWARTTSSSSVIWPGILLGHNGEGDHGGAVGPLGELRLPDELVSSEYLTMSGSKFSTSRGRVIYVGDFLREFGPDALRYFIAVAGPETTDTDFTWDEFVRRTNFELANEWGNLVNRSISMAHKNNGAIPSQGNTLAIDADLLAVACRVRHGRGAAWPESISAGHLRGDAHRGAANKYISDTEPWKLADDPVRRDTVLHTALQVVSDVNTLLTPSRMLRRRCTRRWEAPASGPPSPRCVR